MSVFLLFYFRLRLDVFPCFSFELSFCVFDS